MVNNPYEKIRLISVSEKLGVCNPSQMSPDELKELISAPLVISNFNPIPKPLRRNYSAPSDTLDFSP